MDALDPDAFARALLGWYAAHLRDLPWRNHHDPYAVLVSEVMLQQTRVATVIPYFERWMAAFPTAASLAAAHEEDVLRLWQGLGYYRRCRNLHLAAKAIVERHDGQLPADLDALRALPGVGPYTAGAVASIAFGLQTPIVDGNVVRVLSRVARIEGPPSRAATQRAIWALAGRLVPAAAPGDFNQALMELGATLCSPRSPACSRCPVADSCAGFRHGDATQFPAREAESTVPTLPFTALVASRPDGTVMVQQRPKTGLLASLWEPPLRPAAAPLEAKERVEAAVALWASAIGGTATSLRRCGTVTHIFSHRRFEVDVWSVAVASPEGSASIDDRLTSPPSVEPSYVDARWASIVDESAPPLSRLATRVLAAAGLQPRARGRTPNSSA